MHAAGDPNRAPDLAVGLRISRSQVHLVMVCLARAWNEAVAKERPDVANAISPLGELIRLQAKMEGMTFEGDS